MKRSISESWGVPNLCHLQLIWVVQIPGLVDIVECCFNNCMFGVCFCKNTWHSHCFIFKFDCYLLSKWTPWTGIDKSTCTYLPQGKPLSWIHVSKLEKWPHKVHVPCDKYWWEGMLIANLHVHKYEFSYSTQQLLTLRDMLCGHELFQ